MFVESRNCKDQSADIRGCDEKNDPLAQLKSVFEECVVCICVTKSGAVGLPRVEIAGNRSAIVGTFGKL